MARREEGRAVEGPGPQTTTGVASAAISHIWVMDSGIAIDSTITGTAKTAATISRRSNVGSL